jgi:hypothetical protein
MNAYRHLRRCVASTLVLACTMVCVPGSLAADDAETLERRVKAAFVYKFLSFVEWPASSFVQTDGPIVVGVAGSDDLASELSALVAGRVANERAVSVRRVREPVEVSGLHALFIGRSEARRLASFARAAQQSNVLLISESPGALAQGSMINFVIVEGRVRFEVALDAVERANLRLSSRLLAVAHSVRTGGS